MEKLHLVIETVGDKRADYKTDIDSLEEFKQIVALINLSEDATFIVAGDVAIRAGNIRSMYIEGDKQ